MNEIAEQIWNQLDTNDLEVRELNAGCDFEGTKHHYIKAISEKFKGLYSITDEYIAEVKNEFQILVNNDFSCEE